MKHIFRILILLICSCAWLRVQGQIEAPKSDNLSNTEHILYFPVGVGYNLITLKDDFISPNVYSGSGFYISLGSSAERKPDQWIAEGDVRAGWLKPESDQNPTMANTPQFEEIAKHKLSYLRANFLINGDMQLKQSSHFLGGGIGVTYMRAKLFRPDKNASFYSLLENISSRDFVLVGNVSYTYKRRVFKRPLHVNIRLPLVHLQRFQRKVWTFGSLNNYLQPAVNIGFVLNEYDEDFTNYQLFYNWQMTQSGKKEGVGYQHLSAINSIGLLIKFNAL